MDPRLRGWRRQLRPGIANGKHRFVSRALKSSGRFEESGRVLRQIRSSSEIGAGAAPVAHRTRSAAQSTPSSSCTRSACTATTRRSTTTLHACALERLRTRPARPDPLSATSGPGGHQHAVRAAPRRRERPRGTAARTRPPRRRRRRPRPSRRERDRGCVEAICAQRSRSRYSKVCIGLINTRGASSDTSTPSSLGTEPTPIDSTSNRTIRPSDSVRHRSATCTARISSTIKVASLL